MNAIEIVTWAALAVAVLAAAGCVWLAVVSARARRRAEASQRESQALTQEMLQRGRRRYGQ